MRRLYERQAYNSVTAVFEAGVVSFEVSETVTLEELAKRLAHLGERQGEALTGVELMRRSKLRPNRPYS